jgi:hypothetical protein
LGPRLREDLPEFLGLTCSLLAIGSRVKVGDYRARSIRFPPGWFDAKPPNFWSYPVLYRLDGDVLASRDEMEKALRSYEAGLYGGAFGKSKIEIDIGEDRKAEKSDHAA